MKREKRKLPAFIGLRALKRVRVDRVITQTELAETVGIGVEKLAAIERGSGTTRETAGLIAKALHISLKCLRYGPA